MRLRPSPRPSRVVRETRFLPPRSRRPLIINFADEPLAKPTPGIRGHAAVDSFPPAGRPTDLVCTTATTARRPRDENFPGPTARLHATPAAPPRTAYTRAGAHRGHGVRPDRFILIFRGVKTVSARRCGERRREERDHREILPRPLRSCSRYDFAYTFHTPPSPPPVSVARPCGRVCEIRPFPRGPCVSSAYCRCYTSNYPTPYSSEYL